MNRLTFVAMGIGFVLGLAAAIAVGQLMQSDTAPWVGSRDLRGCWSSGGDTLTIRAQGPRSHELEARFGSEDQWRDIRTRLDGAVISARFSSEPDLYEFRFEAARESDRMTVISALGDERTLLRCEPAT